MKNEHTDQWGAALQVTDAPQILGHLAQRHDSGVIGYCCIGFGCHRVAGMEPVAVPEDGYRFEHAFGLAPEQFLDWLGLDTSEPNPINHAGGPDGESEDAVDEYALYVDFGDLLDRCIIHGTVPGGRADCAPDNPACAYPPYAHTDTAALHHLNDTFRLSFAQIGDLIRYFGVVA